MPNEVLVNDTVRIKVKFIDINPSTGAQVPVAPVSVVVRYQILNIFTILPRLKQTHIE